MQQGQYFDASTIPPEQGGGLPKHPIGKFPAGIVETAIKPVRDSNSQFLELIYQTQAGKIAHRFNLWHDNPQTVEIAQKQLSAVCHATGIYKLDMAKGGAELLNASLMIEVREQPKNAAYNEVFKVYDKNGNEPGQPAQQGQQAQQPQQSQQPAWQQPAQQQPQNQPQPQPQPQGGGQPWQPGGGGNNGGGGGDAKAPWQK